MYDRPHLIVKRNWATPPDGEGEFQPPSIEYLWPDGASAAWLHAIELGSQPYAPGSIVRLGPLHLRVIAYHLMLDSVLVMRESWLAFAYQYRHALFMGMDSIYRRLIITAMVWGLARQLDNARLPTWRDLYMAQRLLRLLKRGGA